MSLAIKKIFPNFYKFSKKITNQIPMKTSLWNNKNYNFNLRIYKMLNLWKSGELGEEAKLVYRHYNGGDFIDVGSWTGFYSFLLSPKANNGDNFLSCEPDHNIHSEIRENLSILKKKFKDIKYSLIPTPINNGKEVVIYHNEWGHPCYLEYEQVKEQNIKFEQKFISGSVDKLVSNLSLSPSFIKIDTEGAEFDVLKGMKETLKRFKPKIMLEKHPTMIPNNISINIIDNFLKENNYKSELINKNELTIREIWE